MTTTRCSRCPEVQFMHQAQKYQLNISQNDCAVSTLSRSSAVDHTAAKQYTTRALRRSSGQMFLLGTAR